MKTSQLSRLSDQYLAALRRQFEQDPPVALPAAHALGSLTVALGLETLDLAKIHELALAALLLPDSSAAVRKAMTARAVLFFTEAIVPIEETHRIALEASVDLKQLNVTLSERTQELTDTNRELQRGITARKTAEAALETSERAFDLLLKESLLLEKNLLDMTRKILAANEEERKKMSLQLHDEIGQTLLGIHVKLLSLKKEAAAQHLGLAKEIATTQRLVEASVETINRFAHEFGTPHKT
ncbi:histidine kinase [Prosthecobacter sp.]|uniref:histidine kinase n=1 Tax=Prosthecobacter sp. TaxID=1965333 RepID=UPI002ABC12B2|nr:histidine kinase [Prosthecobacter sp.]MDZ4401749.1 histidine kinase [Prosthecobacter sp.]